MIYWENVVNITFPIVHYTNKEMLIDTLRAIVNNSFKKCIYEKKKQLMIIVMTPSLMIHSF